MKKNAGESKGKRDKEKQGNKLPWDDLGDLDELLGLNEEEPIIEFQCIDCGCIDEVPAFVVGEFSVGLKAGEEVEMFCPECNGTIRRKK
jgi:hypothetical protein